MPKWSDRNGDYPTAYRGKPGMFTDRRDMLKVTVPAVCGLGGWVMVGLLIWWAVKG